MLDPNALTHHRDLVERRASVAERVAAGKLLRKTVPRRAHSEFRPESGRDALTVLEAENVTRLPDLVPVRTARMLASPFAFLRGSAAVMAADLAPTPTTGLRVQACGDMHVANFGVFASAERQLLFAINDFDETQPGPWEWDVKRLAASAFVASHAHRRRCRRARGRSARRGVELPPAHAPLCRDGRAGALVRHHRQRTPARFAAAGPAQRRRRDRRQGAQAQPHAGARQDDRPGGRPAPHHRAAALRGARAVDLQRPADRGGDGLLPGPVPGFAGPRAPPAALALPGHRRAQKVVGVGSVGTRCWVILLQGRDEDDPLFLQFKEAQPSVLSPYADGIDLGGAATTAGAW